MKRIVASMLVVMVVLAMAVPGASGRAGAAEKEKQYVIGVSMPFMGHPIRQASLVLIEEWKKTHPNVSILVTDGQLKAEKQIADIEDLMAKRVDALTVAAHQSSSLVAVLREVNEAGIPIFPFDRILVDPSVQTGMVMNDDFIAGVEDGKMMATALGGKGKIVTILGPAGSTVADARHGGFYEEIAKHPGIVVAAEQVANFQRVQAVDVFENMLQANPDINGVFCDNDEMALGAVKVLKDAGKLEGVAVYGIDGQKDALESIIKGEMSGTVRKNIEVPYVLDMAYEYLTTGKCEESITLYSFPINKDNVQQYYEPNAVF